MNGLRTASITAALIATLSGTSALGFVAKTIPPKNPAIEKLVVSGNEAAEAGKNAEAEKFYKAAEAKCELPAGEHDHQLADLLLRMQTFYHHQKKYGEAVTCAKRLISIQTKLYGTRHFFYAQCLKNTGDLYFDARNYSAARNSYTKALELAIGAFTGQYAWHTNSEVVKKDKQGDFIVSCFDGIARTFDKEKDPNGMNATYTRAVNDFATIQDPGNMRKTVQLNLLNHFRDFLETADRPDELAGVEKEIAECKRLQKLGQDYYPGRLPEEPPVAPRGGE